MQTVRSINVQELKEKRKATVLQLFSMSQTHNPDPPAEVSPATASTVPVGLMSSRSNSFPSSLPNPAVWWEETPHPTPHKRTPTHTHSLYPTIYMNTAALIKDLEMDLIPHNITLLSQAQCIQSLFCIVRIQLRVIRTDFWGACGWIGLGNGAVGELTKAAPHQPPPSTTSPLRSLADIVVLKHARWQGELSV